MPRPRLAGASGLRALQLRHAQLEDPRRIFLRLVGPRNTLFSRRQLRIARSVCGRERRLGDHRAAAQEREPVHDAVDAVSATSVSVSHTSTCFATSTASAGVTNTIAAAMKAPNSAHRPTVTTGERLNDATRSVRPDGGTALGRLRVPAIRCRDRPRAARRSAAPTRPDVGLLAGLCHRVGDHVRDLLLGAARRDRELLVVARAPRRVAQYAAGMIDEAQGLFDISLAVARLRVILADHPPQRRAHFLVRGGGEYAQGFVEGGFHRAVSPGTGRTEEAL
jgi:hypothetical protein